MVATKSVASQPDTTRICSPPTTSTQSHTPEAMAIYPSLMAEAPEAGPFSMHSAMAGRIFRVSTRAEAEPLIRLSIPAPMEATNTWSITLSLPVLAPASSMAWRAA